MVIRTAGRALVRAGAIGACAITIHTAANLQRLRSPQEAAEPIAERVSVLVPARDEAEHIEAVVLSVLSQSAVPDLEVVILDDGSSDHTAEILGRLAAGDPRVRVVHGPNAAPPAGWLGKTWACQRLSDIATGTVLAFVDADVLLYPHAIAAAASLLRDGRFAMVSPYPLQMAEGALERLVQPLVVWSWVATPSACVVGAVEQAVTVRSERAVPRDRC